MARDDDSRRRERTGERGRYRRRGDRYDPDDPRNWDPGHRYGWAGSGRDLDRAYGPYRRGYDPRDFYEREYPAVPRERRPDFTTDYNADEYRYGRGAHFDDDMPDDASGLYVPGPHTGRGPEGYQRSDERIVEDVNEQLTRHGHVDARNIRAVAENGEVTLEGTVDSRRAKRMAEDATDDVPGVHDVHNRLRIDRDLSD